MWSGRQKSNAEGRRVAWDSDLRERNDTGHSFARPAATKAPSLTCPHTLGRWSLSAPPPAAPPILPYLRHKPKQMSPLSRLTCVPHGNLDSYRSDVVENNDGEQGRALEIKPKANELRYCPRATSCRPRSGTFSHLPAPHLATHVSERMTWGPTVSAAGVAG